MNLNAILNRPAARQGSALHLVGAEAAAPTPAADAPRRPASTTPRPPRVPPVPPVPLPRLTMGRVDGWAGVEFDGGCPHDRAAW